tara:strand:+ start:168 stop:464 length:297 start_codon:yes stop_codon:yes gene_type:complete
MIQNGIGVANERGSITRAYTEGEELSNVAEWEQARNAAFISGGLAQETKVVKPTETKTAAPERARKADGTLIGDDKSTPDTNEAWVGGKAPKKAKSSD